MATPLFRDLVDLMTVPVKPAIVHARGVEKGINRFNRISLGLGKSPAMS